MATIADELTGAELWILPDGIHINVESPETGRRASVNLTSLIGNLPGAGEVFQEWSAYYMDRFRQAEAAPTCEAEESPAG
jgi:hypothetical protein